MWIKQILNVRGVGSKVPMRIVQNVNIENIEDLRHIIRCADAEIAERKEVQDL